MADGLDGMIGRRTALTGSALFLLSVALYADKPTIALLWTGLSVPTLKLMLGMAVSLAVFSLGYVLEILGEGYEFFRDRDDEGQIAPPYDDYSWARNEVANLERRIKREDPDDLQEFRENDSVDSKRRWTTLRKFLSDRRIMRNAALARLIVYLVYRRMIPPFVAFAAVIAAVTVVLDPRPELVLPASPAPASQTKEQPSCSSDPCTPHF